MADDKTKQAGQADGVTKGKRKAFSIEETLVALEENGYSVVRTIPSAGSSKLSKYVVIDGNDAEEALRSASLAQNQSYLLTKKDLDYFAAIFLREKQRAK